MRVDSHHREIGMFLDSWFTYPESRYSLEELDIHDKHG